MSDEQIIRILVADDEEGIRRGVRRALEGLTIEGEGLGGTFTTVIDEAVDGTTALRKLKENEFDLIMLDHHMPGCTGMDILAELVESKADTLAIMVTACFLLYAPAGAWNFGKAMSGAAWLTANLLVLAEPITILANPTWLPKVLRYWPRTGSSGTVPSALNQTC